MSTSDTMDGAVPAVALDARRFGCGVGATTLALATGSGAVLTGSSNGLLAGLLVAGTLAYAVVAGRLLATSY